MAAFIQCLLGATSEHYQCHTLHTCSSPTSSGLGPPRVAEEADSERLSFAQGPSPRPKQSRTPHVVGLGSKACPLHSA